MKLFYKPQALKQLKKLPKSEARKVLKKLEKLPDDPFVGKPLKGEFEGLMSLRAWPYRIIYEVRKKEIVYSVSHRQGVYK
jgi:addiction module RelE/StbE family toxin